MYDRDTVNIKACSGSMAVDKIDYLERRGKRYSCLFSALWAVLIVSLLLSL